MSTTVTAHPQLTRVQAVTARLAGRFSFTRLHLQVAVGALWLLDGALQAQPFMFTRGFATQIIAPTGQGQPGVVAGPVHLGSTIIAAHPVVWNVLFAAAQILLGVGLILARGRAARVALAASIGWALGVWYLGEGLSGLASGHASLVSGAPGSALLYAIFAAAAWPRRGTSGQVPASWLLPVWALLWIVAAGYQLLPGQDTGTALAGLLSSGGGDPHWLASLDAPVASWMSGNGALAVSGLAALELLVGLGALSRRTRTWSLAIGLVVILAIWVLGQDLGQLYSGRATDPNSAPLIALMAIVLIGARSSTPRTPT
ncbi:MAG TPA: hypothetical protein VG294_06050 [Solirubrobacteraceae bacterium]|jgi:hypothetical protein|nr:hypothetical protein [Solirubrobacteraceae bacterium]